MKIEIDLKQINNLKDFQKNNFRNQNLQDLESSYLSSDERLLIMRVNMSEIKNIVSEEENVLAKTIAKGFQYKKMLDNGVSIAELAVKEQKVTSYISRVVRLSFLSPKLIEKIIKGNYSKNLTLVKLHEISKKPDWNEQDSLFKVI